jgi:hypothetical protein
MGSYGRMHDGPCRDCSLVCQDLQRQMNKRSSVSPPRPRKIGESGNVLMITCLRRYIKDSLVCAQPDFLRASSTGTLSLMYWERSLSRGGRGGRGGAFLLRGRRTVSGPQSERALLGLDIGSAACRVLLMLLISEPKKGQVVLIQVLM